MSDTMVDDNPFTEDDPRHKIRDVIFHDLKETLADVRARAGCRNDLYADALDVFTGRFDAAAQAVSLAIASYSAADTYTSALRLSVEDEIENASQWCPDLIPRQRFLGELRTRLQQRQAHWEKRALQYARESEVRRIQHKPDFAEEHGKAQCTSISNEHSTSQSLSSSPEIVEGRGETVTKTEIASRLTQTDINEDLPGPSAGERQRAEISGHEAQALAADCAIENVGAVRGLAVHPNQVNSKNSEGQGSSLESRDVKKSLSHRLTEFKVINRLRTHDRVAEKLGLDRSVYFDLKGGKKVSEETYIKAALGLGCTVDDLKQ